MKKDIGTLLKIQERDVRICSLKKESQMLPEELSAIKQKVQDVEDKRKEKQEEIKKLQVLRKEMELDLDAKQENIKKFEIQLFQVKTNEEYKAMQKQINDLKFECGILEDKILEKMEEIDYAQGGLKGLEDSLVSVKKELEDKEKEISAKLKLIADDIQKVQADRDLLAKDVSPDFFKKYEIIFRNKQGAALVPIENKTCQGCHMTLPPNVINEVKKGTKIIICDNCARILYYPDTAE